MEPFEYLEHTADVKFRAYGSTPEEMLENSALALFNAMIDTTTVDADESWNLELAAEDMEQLLYDWLSELLYMFEVESTVYSTFEVLLSKENEGWRLNAKIIGEKIDLKKHAFDCEVKAVTLHEFEVRKDDGWMAQVILDV